MKTLYQLWPNGEIPEHLVRPDLRMLAEKGYTWNDPFEIIDIFEKKVAKFAGSKFAIATDSCSNALFLVLKFLGKEGSTVTIPKRTYISIPQQIIHAGYKVEFSDIEWSGSYELSPLRIHDMATRWTAGMHQDDYTLVSFQTKKRVPIGKGGMILTNNLTAANWLKRARHDGRDYNTKYTDDQFSLGWHFNMTPEDAARGIMLMDYVPTENPDYASDNNYTDVSTFFK